MTDLRPFGPLLINLGADIVKAGIVGEMVAKRYLNQ